MRLSTAALLLFVGTSVGYIAYDVWYKKPEVRVPAISPAPMTSAAPATSGATPDFPINRVITDRIGRKIAARLLARSTTEVQFLRESDGNPYQYPIASLSDQDQAFLRNYPATTLGALPTPSRSSSINNPSLAETHLRRERAELEHKIQLWNLELRKQNNKSPILSNDQIKQRIHDCANRIVDIDKQLLEFSFRSAGN
jgi:hypothetical protein